VKAVYFTEHGGTDVLTYGELPDPVPGEGEVLVRVRACGVNHVDLWIRKGLPFLKLHFPFVPGVDIAGELVAVGPGTDRTDFGSAAPAFFTPHHHLWASIRNPFFLPWKNAHGDLFFSLSYIAYERSRLTIHWQTPCHFVLCLPFLRNSAVCIRTRAAVAAVGQMQCTY